MTGGGKPTWRDRRAAREALALTRLSGGTIVLARGRRVAKVARAARAELHRAEEHHRRYWSGR